MKRELKSAITAMLCVGGFVVLCVLTMNCSVDEEPKLPPPQLDYEVAEGVRLWNPKTGVDLVRFESCSVQKRRMGFIALGGFNVLYIKGLVLNLPLEAEVADSTAESTESAESGETQSAGKEALSGLLPKSLLEKTGLMAKRFSGIKVDGFMVNRIVNRSEVPVFAAKTMKNRGKVLEMMNCQVFADDGTTNLVGTATLRLNPVPALVWDGGERRLDDLLK